MFDDELVFYEGLGLLWRFSLIGRSQKKDSAVIHRLIQAVLRDELLEAEMNWYLDEVIGISKVIYSIIALIMRNYCEL